MSMRAVGIVTFAAAVLASSCSVGISRNDSDAGLPEPSTSAAETDSTITGSSATGSSTGSAGGSRDTPPTIAGPTSTASVDATRLADSIWRSVAQRREPTAVVGTTVVTVTDHGAVPDDGGDDHGAFAAAIQAAVSTGGGTVLVPTGIFDLRHQLLVPSGINLAGEDRAASRVLIDLGGNNLDGINIQGRPASDWVTVAQPAFTGDTAVTVTDASSFWVGAIIEIERDNDDEAMNTRDEWDVDWGAFSVGEMAQIVSIDGTVLRLDRPLAADYSASTLSRVRVIDPVHDTGVTNLTVERLDGSFAANIAFRWASDVWVHEVISRRAGRAHVAAEMAYRCAVTDSDLAGAHDHGDGGLAYGISLARHATSCLVENNTLYDLRHALILQLGANTNVVAYNHARGSAGYADRQPRADISLHGHWPFNNLFEGNVVDRVVFGDWWGPAGHHNVLHRNCILDEVAVIDHSNDQRIEANIWRPDALSVDDGIEVAVAANRTRFGAPVDAVSPASYYLATVPPFLTNSQWPPIDSSSDDGTCALPAGAASPHADPERAAP